MTSAAGAALTAGDPTEEERALLRRLDLDPADGVKETALRRLVLWALRETAAG
jgi:hypothetical protein